MTAIELRLGDDCRLTAPSGGLEADALVTVSGAPYNAGSNVQWAECEYGPSGEPKWAEFPVSLLQPLCAACTADAATRGDAGDLMCTRCTEDHPWTEDDHS